MPDNRPFLTLERAILYARNAADTVWSRIGPTGFNWLDTLGCHATVLAQFVAARPDAPASALYHFAVMDQRDAAQWVHLPPELRVAIEIFRATFLILYQAGKAEAKATGATAPRVVTTVTGLGSIPYLEPKGSKYPARGRGGKV